MDFKGVGSKIQGGLRKIVEFRPGNVPLGKSAVGLLVFALVKGLDQAYAPIPSGKIGADGKPEMIQTLPQGVLPIGLAVAVSMVPFLRELLGSGLSELIAIFGLIEGADEIFETMGFEMKPLQDVTKKVAEITWLPGKPKLPEAAASTTTQQTVTQQTAPAQGIGRMGSRGAGRVGSRAGGMGRIGMVGNVAAPAASLIRMQAAKV